MRNLMRKVWFAAATAIAAAGLANLAIANIGPIYGGITFSTFFTSPSPGVIDVAASGVTPGSYTNANVTINSQGQITTASNGAAGGAGLYSSVLSSKPTTSTLPNSLNLSTTTVTSSLAGLTLVPPSSAGDNLRVRYTAAPGTTPYSFGAYVCVEGPLNSGGNTQVGIGWYDGSAKLQSILLENSSSGWTLNVNNWTNVTTFSASLFNVASPFSPCGWLGIKNDGTNIDFAWSADGVQYYIVATQTLASSFLGSANYNDVIVYIDDTRSSTTSGATLMSWTQNAW